MSSKVARTTELERRTGRIRLAAMELLLSGIEASGPIFDTANALMSVRQSMGGVATVEAAKKTNKRPRETAATPGQPHGQGKKTKKNQHQLRSKPQPVMDTQSASAGDSSGVYGGWHLPGVAPVPAQQRHQQPQQQQQLTQHLQHHPIQRQDMTAIFQQQQQQLEQQQQRMLSSVGSVQSAPATQSGQQQQQQHQFARHGHYHQQSQQRHHQQQPQRQQQQHQQHDQNLQQQLQQVQIQQMQQEYHHHHQQQRSAVIRPGSSIVPPPYQRQPNLLEIDPRLRGIPGVPAMPVNTLRPVPTLRPMGSSTATNRPRFPQSAFPSSDGRVPVVRPQWVQQMTVQERQRRQHAQKLRGQQQRAQQTQQTQQIQQIQQTQQTQQIQQIQQIQQTQHSQIKQTQQTQQIQVQQRQPIQQTLQTQQYMAQRNQQHHSMMAPQQQAQQRQLQAQQLQSSRPNDASMWQIRSNQAANVESEDRRPHQLNHFQAPVPYEGQFEQALWTNQEHNSPAANAIRTGFNGALPRSPPFAGSVEEVVDTNNQVAMLPSLQFRAFQDMSAEWLAVPSTGGNAVGVNKSVNPRLLQERRSASTIDRAKTANTRGGPQQLGQTLDPTVAVAAKSLEGHAQSTTTNIPASGTTESGVGGVVKSSSVQVFKPKKPVSSNRLRRMEKQIIRGERKSRKEKQKVPASKQPPQVVVNCDASMTPKERAVQDAARLKALSQKINRGTSAPTQSAEQVRRMQEQLRVNALSQKIDRGTSALPQSIEQARRSQEQSRQKAVSQKIDRGTSAPPQSSEQVQRYQEHARQQDRLLRQAQLAMLAHQQLQNRNHPDLPPLRPMPTIVLQHGASPVNGSVTMNKKRSRENVEQGRLQRIAPPVPALEWKGIEQELERAGTNVQTSNNPSSMTEVPLPSKSPRQVADGLVGAHAPGELKTQSQPAISAVINGGEAAGVKKTVPKPRRRKSAAPTSIPQNQGSIPKPQVDGQHISALAESVRAAGVHLDSPSVSSPMLDPSTLLDAPVVRPKPETVMVFCKRDFMRFQAGLLWRKYQEIKRKRDQTLATVTGRRARYLSARYRDSDHNGAATVTPVAGGERSSGKRAKRGTETARNNPEVVEILDDEGDDDGNASGTCSHDSSDPERHPVETLVQVAERQSMSAPIPTEAALDSDSPITSRVIAEADGEHTNSLSPAEQVESEVDSLLAASRGCEMPTSIPVSAVAPPLVVVASVTHGDEPVKAAEAAEESVVDGMNSSSLSSIELRENEFASETGGVRDESTQESSVQIDRERSLNGADLSCSLSNVILDADNFVARTESVDCAASSAEDPDAAVKPTSTPDDSSEMNGNDELVDAPASTDASADNRVAKPEVPCLEAVVVAPTYSVASFDDPAFVIIDENTFADWTTSSGSEPSAEASLVSSPSVDETLESATQQAKPAAEAESASRELMKQYLSSDNEPRGSIMDGIRDEVVI